LLVSFKLRVAHHHARLVYDDGRVADVDGDALAPVLEAAEPLLAYARRRCDGPLRALSVGIRERVLRATCDTDSGVSALRVDGAEFDRDVAPLCAPLDMLVVGAAAPWPAPLATLPPAELRRAIAVTVEHYNRGAQSFWQGTRDHDVSQNIAALLRHLPASGSHTILDLGCGPGRDLIALRDLGHVPVGLDAAEAFVQMARQHTGCEVLHQDLLRLDLPSERFDGVFANAVLFHVPSQELPRVLRELWDALAFDGVLFSSNPHGPNREGWSGDRYGCYLNLETYRRFMTATGFVELEHYYRPTGRPRHEQPWLASVWRKPATERS
jgi:SAM-dependent methyltransferase